MIRVLGVLEVVFDQSFTSTWLCLGLNFIGVIAVVWFRLLYEYLTLCGTAFYKNSWCCVDQHFIGAHEVVWDRAFYEFLTLFRSVFYKSIWLCVECEYLTLCISVLHRNTHTWRCVYQCFIGVLILDVVYISVLHRSTHTWRCVLISVLCRSAFYRSSLYNVYCLSWSVCRWLPGWLLGIPAWLPGRNWTLAATKGTYYMYIRLYY